MAENENLAGEARVEPPHSTVELPEAALTRPAVPGIGSSIAIIEAPRMEDVRGSRMRMVRRVWTSAAVLGLLGVLVALVLVVQSVGLLPRLGNPFAKHTTDSSQPVLLLEIRDLSRYVAAEGNFQVVVDLKQDRKYIPDFLVNRRTLFVAAGTVEAYVDFAGIGEGAITQDANRRVEITLPAAVLAKPNLDHQNTYVFAEQVGVLDWIQDTVDRDPNRQQLLYELAEQKIGDAAKQAGLIERAEANTRSMLDSMLRSLGFAAVKVNFVAP